MFRLLVVPAIIGILAFSIVYFVTPLLFSESDVVAVFAQFTLDLSNSVFASMPPIVADFIANLKLSIVALAIALMLVVTVQILVLIVAACRFTAKAVMAIFNSRPKQAEPTALPSLDFDAGRSNSRPGNKILGGGFDSLDPD